MKRNKKVYWEKKKKTKIYVGKKWLKIEKLGDEGASSPRIFAHYPFTMTFDRVVRVKNFISNFCGNAMGNKES